MESHPRKVRIVGACFGGGLVLLVLIGWVTLPEHLQAQFTAAQLITLLGVLAGLMTGIVALGSSVVRADGSGLLVRNGFNTHRLSWSQVRQISYRDGDPWAAALLNADNGDDDDIRRLGLMGIQRNDGRRSADAVVELRRMLAEAEGADRGDSR